jgi:hypothetical protein
MDNEAAAAAAMQNNGERAAGTAQMNNEAAATATMQSNGKKYTKTRLPPCLCTTKEAPYAKGHLSTTCDCDYAVMQCNMYCCIVR